MIAEYESLREEIHELNTLASSALNFSVVATGGLLGYLVQIKKITFLFFFLPFLIVIPSSYIILSRFQAISRIGSYIRIFLESEQGLYHETRLGFFRQKWQSSHKKVQLSYRETIFILYCCFYFLDIGLFVSVGFTEWHHLVCYGLPLPYYIYYYYLSKKNWNAVYERCWQHVKENMDNP